MNKWRTAALFTALLMPLAAEQAAAETWEARENVALEKQWTIELSEPYKQGINLADYIAVQQEGEPVDVKVEAGQTEKEIVVTPATRYEENTAYELHIDETLPANFDATLKEDVVLPFTTELRTPQVDETDREGTATYKANEGLEKLVAVNEGDVIHFTIDGSSVLPYEAYKWDTETLAWEKVSTSSHYPKSNGVFINSEDDTFYKIVMTKQESEAELTLNYHVLTAEQYEEQRKKGDDIQTTIVANEYHMLEYILSAGEALELIARADTFRRVSFQYYENLQWNEVDYTAATYPVIDYRYFAAKAGRYRLNITASNAKEQTDLSLKSAIFAGDDQEVDSFENPRVMTEKKGDVIHTLQANRDIDYFSYTLTAGQAVAIQTAEDVTVTMYKKNERLNEWEQIDRVIGKDDGVDYSFKAEEDGGYIITLENEFALTYKTRNLLFSYEVLDGDEGENDSFTNPRVMTEKKGEVVHTLNANKDVDYFNYTLTAGQAVAIQTVENVTVTMYKKNERLNEWVKVDQMGSGKEGLDYSFKVEEDGDYIITLENIFAQQYKTRKILFSYEVLDGDAGENDSFTNPRVMTEKKGEVTHTLNANKDMEYFSYALTAGQAVAIQTVENVTVTMYKKDERLNEWKEVDRVIGSKTGIDYSFKAEEDGDYIITLENVFAQQYKMRDIVFSYEVLDGDAGENDSWTNPRVMTEASGQITHTLHANKDVDFFSYTLKAGQTLTIQAAPNVTVEFYENDTRLSQWKQLDSVLGENEGIHKSFNIVADGEYLIVLSNKFSNAYQLNEIPFIYSVTQ